MINSNYKPCLAVGSSCSVLTTGVDAILTDESFDV